MHVFVCVVVVALSAVFTNALNIVNISEPVKLTSLFIDNNANSGTVMEVIPGSMSYYVDPTSKEKYVWYGMNYQINNTEIISGLKSDVFNQDFSQYDGIKNLPLEVVQISSNQVSPDGYNQLFGNGMCTSPISNDIMTCWINVTYTSPETPTYQIDCKLYFAATNSFSDIIHITNTKTGYNLGGGLICFDDSYFIPYFHANVYAVNKPSTIDGVLLDLQGNIRYNNISFLNLSLPFGFLMQTFPAKGGSKINPGIIESKATDLFVINFQTFNQSTNITKIVGLYGYYTSLSDTLEFPLNIYQNKILDTSDPGNGIYLLPNEILDFSDRCCYISVYQKYLENSDDDYYSYYAIISDIDGNKIETKQFGTNDIQLKQNVSSDNFPQIVDLPSISDDNTHYFMVTYDIDPPFGYGANTTTVGIYYIQKDADGGQQYDFAVAGYFNTSELVDADSEKRLGAVYAYNLPGTNDIYFSWNQDGGGHVVNGSFVLNVDLYGQTFTLK